MQAVDRIAQFITANSKPLTPFGAAPPQWVVLPSSLLSLRGKPQDPDTNRVLTEDLAPDFNGIVVMKGFTLDNVAFEILPNFTQAPRLDNFTLTETVEPGGFWKSFSQTAPSVTARYRELKRLAIQGQDYDREHKFFKGELRSRRGDEDKAGFVFGILYDALSDFGRSIWRPLGIWFGALLAFAGGYFWLAVGAKPAESGRRAGAALVDAILLSVKNALIFVGGIGRDPGAAQIYHELFGETISPSVYFIELMQTLLSAVLIFLVLLALRNRFRIK
jgi:hypothetical protein